MSRVIVSTSQICLSRQQEEFLSTYRSDSAKKDFLLSYGHGNPDFLAGGYGVNSNKPFNAKVLPYCIYHISQGNVLFDLGVDTSNDKLSIHIGFRPNELWDGNGGRSIFYASSLPSNISNVPYLIYATGASYFNLLYRIPNTYGTTFIYPDGFLYKKIDLVLDGKNYTVSDGTTTRILPFASVEYSLGSLYLFTGKSDNTFPCDLFYIKIYDDGKLIRDILPVLKDGTVCLFDFVYRVFYYNLFDGYLVAGS